MQLDRKGAKTAMEDLHSLALTLRAIAVVSAPGRAAMDTIYLASFGMTGLDRHLMEFWNTFRVAQLH